MRKKRRKWKKKRDLSPRLRGRRGEEGFAEESAVGWEWDGRVVPPAVREISDLLYCRWLEELRADRIVEITTRRS